MLKNLFAQKSRVTVVFKLIYTKSIEIYPCLNVQTILFFSKMLIILSFLARQTIMTFLNSAFFIKKKSKPEMYNLNKKATIFCLIFPAFQQ